VLEKLVIKMLCKYIHSRFLLFFFPPPGNDVIFEDEIEALQVQVNKLTAMGVNKIIALGHSGFTVDINIAQKVKGVDVVIGGHTNTFLYTGILLHAEMFFLKQS